jgi:hypothetical protein
MKDTLYADDGGQVHLYTRDHGTGTIDLRLEIDGWVILEMSYPEYTELPATRLATFIDDIANLQVSLAEALTVLTRGHAGDHFRNSPETRESVQGKSEPVTVQVNDAVLRSIAEHLVATQPQWFVEITRKAQGTVGDRNQSVAPE